MVERLDEMPKPIEDGFPYDVETDSLADSLGLRLPNRSLIMLQGEVGSGKSLVSCLLYTSPSPRDKRQSRMPSSA